jgi:hypothetical protein
MVHIHCRSDSFNKSRIGQEIRLFTVRIVSVEFVNRSSSSWRDMVLPLETVTVGDAHKHQCPGQDSNAPLLASCRLQGHHSSRQMNKSLIGQDILPTSKSFCSCRPALDTNTTRKEKYSFQPAKVSFVHIRV